MQKHRKTGIPHFNVRIVTLLISMVWPTISFSQNTCSVALVLALDVSGSVDWTEFRLQKNGVADAFKDPEVIELISRLPGGISVAITHWSGATSQRIAVQWTNVKNSVDAIAFAKKIESDKRVRTGSLTAIGQALIHADLLLSANPTRCNRNVIDISSDGRSNRGANPTIVSDRLAAKDITINALVIVNKDRTLVPYFQKEIIMGADAFVQSTVGYEDYARAIKQKLLRELTSTTAQNTQGVIFRNSVAHK